MLEVLQRHGNWGKKPASSAVEKQIMNEQKQLVAGL